MKGGSISISRGSCFLLFLVTLICIEYDAFVCFNVFVTLTPMGFLLFFAVFTKSTKQLVLNMAAMERIAFFLCFRFVILTRVGSDAVAMGKKLCRIFYRQRINFTFGEETKALQNAATIL